MHTRKLCAALIVLSAASLCVCPNPSDDSPQPHSSLLPSLRADIADFTLIYFSFIFFLFLDTIFDFHAFIRRHASCPRCADRGSCHRRQRGSQRMHGNPKYPPHLELSLLTSFLRKLLLIHAVCLQEPTLVSSVTNGTLYAAQAQEYNQISIMLHLPSTSLFLMLMQHAQFMFCFQQSSLRIVLCCL